MAKAANTLLVPLFFSELIMSITVGMLLGEEATPREKGIIRRVFNRLVLNQNFDRTAAIRARMENEVSITKEERDDTLREIRSMINSNRREFVWPKYLEAILNQYFEATVLINYLVFMNSVEDRAEFIKHLKELRALTLAMPLKRR